MYFCARYIVSRTVSLYICSRRDVRMHAVRHSFPEAVVVRAGEHVVPRQQQEKLFVTGPNAAAVAVVQQSSV